MNLFGYELNSLSKLTGITANTTNEELSTMAYAQENLSLGLTAQDVFDILSEFRYAIANRNNYASQR